MRKLLLTIPLLAALSIGCDSKPPVGPGTVTITETTTSTSTTTTMTTTTSTIPEPTIARFVFSPLTPQVLQNVNFNASSSTPGTGRTIVSYSWDFGDGDPMKTGVTTTHDFTISGVYLVTLTVTDSSGQKVTTAQPVTVRPAPPMPMP
jgi:PKD repeat protein